MSRGNRGRNNKKRIEQDTWLEEKSEEKSNGSVVQFNPQKDQIVKEQTHLNEVKQNMKRTGKSKEYINKLSRHGCPNGRKNNCCTLKYSKKSLNQRRNSGQNKSLNAVKNEFPIDSNVDQAEWNEQYITSSPPNLDEKCVINDNCECENSSEKEKCERSEEIEEIEEIEESEESEEFEVIKLN